MTANPASAGGAQPPSGAGSGSLVRLSLRSKALVIANEYTHRQMQPDELRQVLVAFAPAPEEQARVAKAVEEELRAARYPVGEIIRLISALMPGSAAPAEAGPRTSEGQPSPPAADPNVMITRKARPPHLMPFEKFQFEAPAPGEEEPQPPPAGHQDGAAASADPSALDDGARTHVKPAQPAGRAQPFAPSPSGRPVVLVADDDQRAREICRAKLEQAGYSVIEAKDGIDAWNHIRHGLVHCAVMDMKMPGYHGLEILSRMVDAGMTLPVVVVSAFDQLANEYVVSTYPRLKFFTKPAPPEMVTEAVNAFLRPGGKAGEAAQPRRSRQA